MNGYRWTMGIFLVLWVFDKVNQAWLQQIVNGPISLSLVTKREVLLWEDLYHLWKVFIDFKSMEIPCWWLRGWRTINKSIKWLYSLWLYRSRKIHISLIWSLLTIYRDLGKPYVCICNLLRFEKHIYYFDNDSITKKTIQNRQQGI